MYSVYETEGSFTFTFKLFYLIFAINFAYCQNNFGNRQTRESLETVLCGSFGSSVATSLGNLGVLGHGHLRNDQPLLDNRNYGCLVQDLSVKDMSCLGQRYV